ncbi:MAG TPA: alkaline phosphatase family protein [Myxococcota bacterium]|nr:alkaline phosphatase family protein [Myxococcota bacterium]
MSSTKPLTNATLRIGLVLAASALVAATAHCEGNLHKVNHIIVVMQENHSFDNYFGALPYVPGGLYHGGPCSKNDHRCVDGLSCTQDGAGDLRCSNSNVDDDGSTAFAFHDPRYCVGPDLDHGWPGSHLEANFSDPAGTLASSPNDGFVRQNDGSSQPDHGAETPTDDDTMGFYTQADLPFYYSLAQTFAIDDRYFASVIGPTFPNRAYAAAATSFGHLTTSEILPPGTGYKPITGTIYDLLDANGIPWVDYFSDVPISAIFRLSAPPFVTPHSQPVSVFLAQAAAGTLPPVAFVDPNFGFLGPANENDEHPPTNIRKGEAFVSTIVNAVRNGPNWKDSIVFVTYDEHGGFYDHVAPAPAPQRGALSPDGIDPGQCADLSNPPTSETPGNGANCSVSRQDALAICPGFTNSGPYPAECAHFDQVGFRVPFIAVSPFAKPGYVSHTVGDHTSILALIEKRFLSNNRGNGNSHIQHLTLRDAEADPLEDLFNFSSPPSMNASIPTAPGASPSDPGCPFVPPHG